MNLHELGFDNIFLAITTTKIDKLHLIKIKKKTNFCVSDSMINKVKNQPTKWEKIFSHYVYDRFNIQNR